MGWTTITDEEFEAKLDEVLESLHTDRDGNKRNWYYWNKAIDAFLIAKSNCILARAVNGGPP